MATVTYISNNYETLAEAMQQLVTMGYFASVEYDSANDAVVCYDADENAVLTLTKSENAKTAYTVTFRLSDGTQITKGYTDTNYSCALNRIYICSGGAYIEISGDGRGTAQYCGVIISRTNNDSVGIVCFGNGLVSTRASTVWSFAADDDAAQTNTAYGWAAPTLRNQTVLNDVPTCCAAGIPSYFPDVRFTFTSQFAYTGNTATPPVNFTQNGKRYLWVGYFAIRDEETAA